MAEEILTPPKFAQRLRGLGVEVTDRTVLRWAQSGDLGPVVTLPSGRLMIPISALDRFAPTTPTEAAS